MRLLGTITNKDRKGKVLFVSDINEDDDGRVYFTADADIDADGANGQRGEPAAYKEDDSGTEALVNGGMKRLPSGKVVISESWGRGVAILGADNEPEIFPGGIIGSHTWYRDRNLRADDPAAYVDAETVPYIVVPPLIVQKTSAIVRGCKARVTYKGKSVDCVVADLGPKTKTGELSIAAARAVGIPSNPRRGGISQPDVLYELWPGTAAPGYELQPA